MGIGTKKTIIEVGYRELEDFIFSIYKHQVELVAEEEWNNDEEHSFVVDGELSSYDEIDLEKFQTTGEASFGITGLLLNDLARAGHIEKGEYLVSIC